MMPLNIGIVGTGDASNMHFEALKDISDGCVKAVCGRDIDRLSLKGREWNVHIYTSIPEMVAVENVDIVLIANENFHHASDARLAIEAGAHVLIEKPLDASLSAARDLLDFSNQHKRILGVVLQKRFDPKVVKIKDAIAAKELGQIILARVDVFMHRGEEYFHSKYWIQDPSKVGGGILHHYAIHSIDALLWVMDSQVVSVSGWTSHHARTMPIEDSGGCWVRFENGATACVNASVALHETLRNRLEIFGTVASIHLEEPRLRRLPPPDKNHRSRASELPAGSSMNDLKCVWVDYIDSVRNNRQPRASGASAMKAEELIDALYRSSSDLRTVLLAT